MLTIDTTQPLHVPSNAQFYCLIGRLVGLDAHTFFHMGYIDKSGAAIPLLEVGKLIDFGLQYNDCGLAALCNAMFSQTGAMIHSENRLLRKQCSTQKNIDISYSAYEINRLQYLYFLGVLKGINTQQQQRLKLALNSLFVEQFNNALVPEVDSQQFYKKYLPKGPLYAYQPNVESTLFHYKPIDDWPACIHEPKAELNARFLSYNNSCRHSGLDFLLLALGRSSAEYPPQVSKHFIFPLSCCVTIKAGRYQAPLYLLPLAPNAYLLDNHQKRIASVMYYRMENLLLTNSHHVNTRHKFNLLKSLYQNLLSNKEVELDFLKVVVENYQKPEHKNIINQHRGWHWPFFHSPKTQQMFEQFEFEHKQARRAVLKPGRLS